MFASVSESTGKALVAASIAGLTFQVAGEMIEVMKLRAEVFESEGLKANPKVRAAVASTSALCRGTAPLPTTVQGNE